MIYELELPIRGVSDVPKSTERTGEFTKRLVNMRPDDSRSKRRRLSVRSGLTKFLEAQVAGDFPVRIAGTVTYQKKNVTYTEKTDADTTPIDTLGITDSPYNIRTTSPGTVQSIATDRQGNPYCTNGSVGIAKYNSILEKQWELALPVDQETAIVRALCVGTVPGGDGIGDLVLAGVSAGGRQQDAKLWVYKQTSTKNEKGEIEQKPELVSEIKPGAYTERIKLYNGLAYCAQNEPDKGRAYVRIYSGLSSNLHFQREWEVPYPIYDIDVRQSDGAVVTAHPQNFARGKDPRHLSFSARDLAMEWQLAQHLLDYDKRIWCRFRARELAEALGLEDGDPVPIWPDLGPSGRDLVASSATDATKQPIYVEDGPNGEPCIRFLGGASGLDHFLKSAVNVAVQRQYDDQQRSMLPAFETGRYAVFMLIRPALDVATERAVFGQTNEAVNADADTDQLVHNMTSIATGPFLGTNLMAGKLAWYTTTVGATGEGGSVGVSGGGNNLPFSASFAYSGSNAMALVTIINDGHQGSATEAAQHSVLRVNGRPIDRWVNRQFNSKEPTFVGTDAAGGTGNEFRGDMTEIIVLRDYPDGVDHTGSGNSHGNPVSGNLGDGTVTGVAPALFHYPCAIGTFGTKTARASYFNAINRFNDNEIERIEGMIAGENGISHLLPCGTAAVLSATAIPVAGDTVTIDGRVYTFRAALTAPPVADEIVIGADARATGARLWRAINASGEDGVGYSEDQTQHATVRATEFNDQAAGTFHLKIETRGPTAVAVSEVSGVLSWNVATTTTLASVTATAATFMPGHYPHPFGHLYGFPRPDTDDDLGVEVESKGFLLNQGEGILARWDPQGKIVWVLTSRLAVAQLGGFNLPATDQKFGGVGFACQWSEDGDAVYSVGPQYSTSPTGTAQTAMIRRVLDTPTGYDVTSSGAWALGSTTLIGNAADTHLLSSHPKIDVDEFDNVYLPFDSPPRHATDNKPMSLVCINAAGVVKFRWRKSDTTANPAGNCVAVDRQTPDYDGDPVTRAPAVFLGTRQGYDFGAEDNTQSNVYKIESVEVTHATVAPAETKIWAVANGSLKVSYGGGPFSNPVGFGTLSNPVFATDTDNPEGLYSAATFKSRGLLVITDGKDYFKYDARRDTLAVLVAEVGELKPRARGVEPYRDRLIWYRFADSPTQYLMSRSGDPLDYDFAPAVFDPGQAVLGTLSPKGTGTAPDIINVVRAIGNNRCLFGCQRSIHILDGDPADGGRFIRVSESTGIAFGDETVCSDESGMLYAFGTIGCVYAINPYSNSEPVPISENAIPHRLRHIDLETHRVRLVWSSEDNGVHLFVGPNDPTDSDSEQEHYFWSRATKGWYPDKIASDGMQPSCTFTGDGTVNIRGRAVIGCVDGYMRYFTEDVDDDDGEPILASGDIGPLAGPEGPYEFHFKEPRVVMAGTQSGCTLALYAADNVDDLGPPVATWQTITGRNPPRFLQAVGSYVQMSFSGSEPFGIERIEMDAYPAGTRSVR